MVAGHRCCPTCRGWAHFNVGSDREGIQQCDECRGDSDADDAAASRAHALHCSCGATADSPVRRCHGCGRSVAVTSGYPDVDVVVVSDRAYCSLRCVGKQPHPERYGVPRRCW